MNSKIINKLYDTNDTFSFGQMKGEPFKWIYLLTPNYLVWIIEETNICFHNLELFYQFGCPYQIEKNDLTEKVINEIRQVAKEKGKNLYTGSSEKYLVTIEMYYKILQNKKLKLEIFKPHRDFKFSEKTIELNNLKFKNCKPSYNGINNERNIHLSEVFNNKIL